MSSVRISQHNRAAADLAGPAGVTAKAEAPSGGVGFAVALGAAALLSKEPSVTTFGATTSDEADGATTSRKRTGSDGKGGDAAAVLAAQASLLAVAGQLPVPVHPAVDVPASPSVVPVTELRNSSIPSAGPPGDDFVSTSIAPASDAATALSRHSLADNAPSASMAAGIALPDSMTDDAVTDPSEVSPNLGPELTATPNLNSPPASQPALIGIAQVIPPAIGEPSTSRGDTAFGREGRQRFIPVAAATNAARAAEAMPGAPNDPAALTNASTAATPPTAIGDVAATVSDQVASHVLRLVSSGAREMVMRLHPPELGEVTVRVAVNGRDVSAWFGSPQLHVQTAIAGGIGQLQADLGNAGYNLNGAWVGAEASGSRQQAVNPPLARIPVAVSDPDPRMPATSRPSASGLNIYV